MSEIYLINKEFIDSKKFSEKVMLITKNKGNKFIKDIDEYGTSYIVYNQKTKNYFVISETDLEWFDETKNNNKSEYGNIAQISFSNSIEEEDLNHFIFPFIKSLIDFFPSMLINSGSEINYTYDEFIKFNDE